MSATTLPPPPHARAGNAAAEPDAPAQSPARISLLWPAGPPSEAPATPLGERALDDLDLREVIHLLAGRDAKREPYVTRLLCALSTDLRVIAYRQETMADLVEDATLRRRLWDVVGVIAQLLEWRSSQRRAAWSVTQIARRVAELEHYVDALCRLRAALQQATVHATGLAALRDYVLELTGARSFQSLQAELPGLRARLDKVGSATIGVNLSRDLSPDSATIMSIDEEKLEGRASLLDRLFGGDGPRGITPLHRVDLESPGNALYRDLLRLLEEIVEPVADAIGRYARLHTFVLTDLEPELHVLLCAADLAVQFRDAGLPVCLPAIAPAEERVTRVTEGYNVGLAVRLIRDGGTMVTNETALDAEPARVWIVTGPNRGGKTTYTRGVGQAHVFLQAGLYVAGRAARISPVDAVYTHFAAAETTAVGMGRLDEEAQRLAQIFRAATPQSLILLNEVLAGTSTVEALGLATDAVRGLRLLGARAVYTTHLHELAARADEINAGTPGDALVGSLVAVVEDEGEAVIGPRHRRTFHLVPSPPRYVSYASEIAEQHGISYSQLVQLFAQRGLTPTP